MINFDKFLASFITEMKKYQPITCYNLPGCIKKALEDQGLEYKDGEIVKAQCKISAKAKETLCNKCRKEQPSHSCQDITELGRCAVEYEQKPVDKKVEN